jgi:predicted ATP-grasp superfamily ATP-dependent carboligase
MADRVLILGASGRAAAASARRAGLTPFAVDLFADRDTLALCEHAERCPPDEYPRGLFERARRLPPMPWLYAGGLENHPDLIGELSAERELWGTGPDAVRLVRDPFAVAKMLGSRFPEVRPADGPPPAGDWLRKPLRGAGGTGVRRADPGEDTSEQHFYQRFVPGEPFSLAYRAGPVGFARQLVGTPWLHAGGFRYAGNVSVIAPPARHRDQVLAAARLRAAGGVSGLFGLDFVDDGTATHTVEVNPRYPASVEVHEFATGVSLLGRAAPPPPARRVVGKAVYYAPHALTVPASGPWDDSLTRYHDVWRRPDFADIPHPGDAIPAGQPVVTLLADGPTEAAVLATLRARAADLDRLWGTPP